MLDTLGRLTFALYTARTLVSVVFFLFYLPSFLFWQAATQPCQHTVGVTEKLQWVLYVPPIFSSLETSTFQFLHLPLCCAYFVYAAQKRTRTHSKTEPCVSVKYPHLFSVSSACCPEKLHHSTSYKHWNFRAHKGILWSHWSCLTTWLNLYSTTERDLTDTEQYGKLRDSRIFILWSFMIAHGNRQDTLCAWPNIWFNVCEIDKDWWVFLPRILIGFIY